MLLDLVGGLLESYPIEPQASGTWQCYVQQTEIILWLNGQFTCGFSIPERYPFRLGWVSYDSGVASIYADELFEPVEPIVWSMKDTARAMIDRFLEGRDGYLLERPGGAITVRTMDNPPDLGALTGERFVAYEQGAQDSEWASAMVAYGGEDWVLLLLPDATRLRWSEWQTPYIYDPVGLRSQAMKRLRRQYALRDLRSFQGPLDPRVEPGDRLAIEEIRGIPPGEYLVQSVEIVGKPEAIDMIVTVHGLPEPLQESTWPVTPGIDRPTRGG